MPSVDSTITWLVTIILVLILYTCFFVIYRVLLHPLSKYPGPLLAKVTDWYNVYHSWKGDRHVQLYRLHQRYGPVVRNGPNRVSIATPSSLQPIYGAKANTKKANWYTIWQMLFGAASVATTVDKVDHSRRKRIMQEAFSDSALRDMDPCIIAGTKKFCELLEATDSGKEEAVSKGSELKPEQRWSTPKNFYGLVGFMTFDIMGDIVFSHSFETQTKEDNRYFVGNSLEGLHGLNTVAYMPFLLQLKLDKLLFKSIHNGMERYKRYTAAHATKRISQQDKVKTRDVFSVLLTAKDSVTGRGLTEREMKSESAILISAASHPARTAISAMIFYLLKNPDVMEKVTAEVLSAFSNLDDIRGAAPNSCEYFQACITETLRLSPSLPSIAIRTALSGGVRIDDEYYPEGVDLGTPVYALHRSEEYFPDASAFRPERWILATSKSGLGIATEQSLAKARSAFCPFSLGPMVCLGKSLSYRQISIVVARLIWQYEIRFAPIQGPENKTMKEARRWVGSNEYALIDKFSAEGNGPWVEVRRRMQPN